jgi:hypothetical protein
LSKETSNREPMSQKIDKYIGKSETIIPEKNGEGD